jgi:ABC-type lipoprotein release transport system permease subunit
MSFIAFRMFLRKGGTSSAILAIALLIAIMASANSVVNSINSQATALGSMVDVGQTYLVVQKNSTSITNSEVTSDVANLLANMTDVQYVLPQRILTVTLTSNSTNHTVELTTVDDLPLFFNIKQARMEGKIAESNSLEVNLGVALASLTSTNTSDQITLTFGDKSLKTNVTGTFTTLTQSDAEIVAPTKIAQQLTGENGKLSFIEFSLKTDSSEPAASSIEQTLPSDLKIRKVQQLKSFIQAVNDQTLSFLNVWSVSIFIVIVAASYIVATRLITESSYELAMLRSLGSNRRLLFSVVFTYTVSVASLGAVLGLSIGVVGAQAASTMASWIKPGVTLAPFLEIEQALQLVAFTFLSAILGCLYPAFRHAFRFKMEEAL